MNMALDEALFNNYLTVPVLRFYTWNGAYTTIGYFQKHAKLKKKNFTRRFTGGLTVYHENDISYSFITSSNEWNFVYSQNDTFKQIHLAIQKALNNLDIHTILLNSANDITNDICVQTKYANDLIYHDKKILGSCSRRRGNKILVQGSLYIKLSDKQKNILCEETAKNLTQCMDREIIECDFTNTEIERAKVLAKKIYLNPQWNEKF
jgi:lipoate-protein ligase A